jgi:alpha,alpha-trehalase
VYLHSKAADHLDNRVWAILSRQVDAALKHWREPNAGIWEVRGPLQHFTSSKLLLAPLLRFLPPDDPRIRATVLAIADELTIDGLVLRYRVDETDDGFKGEEGTFTICWFWLVSALCEIDERKRARELCAKLLSLAGPLELYAEEIDPHTGQQLGNFPQAFTHLALINAVLHLIATEQTSETWNESSHPTFDD